MLPCKNLADLQGFGSHTPRGRSKEFCHLPKLAFLRCPRALLDQRSKALPLSGSMLTNSLRSILNGGESSGGETRMIQRSFDRRIIFRIGIDSMSAYFRCMNLSSWKSRKAERSA